jgi:MFS family permease
VQHPVDKTDFFHKDVFKLTGRFNLFQSIDFGGKGMETGAIRSYKYRWVVLAVYVVITAVIEIQWLTFAPIAREARVIYGVSALGIDLLSMIFMGVFLVVCIPASWVIDTWGIRVGIGIGAVLTGVFAMVKGLYPHQYVPVLVAQTGLAVAQPFILNAVTKVAYQWFPITERALAVGLATLAQFLGIIIVMVATPLLVVHRPDGTFDISRMLMIYGLASLSGALIFLALVREKPPTPPDIRGDDSLGVLQGMGHIFRQRDMRLVFPMFFIGLGMFNAVSTCIDQICQAKGLSTDQTGLVGGMMLIAGLLGALVLPLFSDMLRKRKAFIVLAMAGMTPGLFGLAVSNNYGILLLSSFIMGFFLLGAGAPVGFQYSAEVTRPAPESTSQGLILLIGQFSGILFILMMNVMSMQVSLVVFIALAIGNIFLSLGLNESEMIQTSTNAETVEAR